MSMPPGGAAVVSVTSSLPTLTVRVPRPAPTSAVTTKAAG